MPRKSEPLQITYIGKPDPRIVQEITEMACGVRDEISPELRAAINATGKPLVTAPSSIRRSMCHAAEITVPDHREGPVAPVAPVAPATT